MNRRHMLRTVGKVFLLSAVTVLHAGVLGALDNEGEEVKRFEETWLADARTYAQDYGVSEGEALLRMHQMELISNLNHQLMTEEADTFGGLWLNHQPEFRLHVAFTENGEETIGRYVHRKSHLDLTGILTLEDSPVSYQQLIKEHKRTDAMLRKQGVEHDIYLDVRTSRNVLKVLDARALSGFLKKAGLGLPASVEVVEVDQLTVLEANLYGGLTTTPCTAGPSVWMGWYSTYGVSTAYHCTPVSFLGTYLPAKSCQTGYDLCGLDDSGHTTRNWIKDGPSSYRIVTQIKWRSQMYDGQAVYKYGKCSGFTAGTITEPYWNSYWAAATNNSCGGDSGGPWFWASYVFGGHIGVSGADHLFVVPDYFNSLGLTIRTW